MTNEDYGLPGGAILNYHEAGDDKVSGPGIDTKKHHLSYSHQHDC